MSTLLGLQDRNEKLEAAWNAVKDGKGLPGLPPPDPVLLQQPPPPPAAGTTPSNAAPSVKLGADVLATLTAQHQQQQQQLLMQQTQGQPAPTQQQQAQQQPVDAFAQQQQQQLQQALAAQVSQQVAAAPHQAGQQPQQQQPTGSNTVPLHHLLQGSGLQALLQGQGLQQLQTSLQVQQQPPPQQQPQPAPAQATVQAVPGNNGMVVLQVPLSQLQLPPGLSPQQQQQLLLGQALLSMQPGGQQQPQGSAQLVITPSTAAPAVTTTTTGTSGAAAGGGTNADASTAAPTQQASLSLPGQANKGPVLTFNEDLFASKAATGQGVGQLQVTSMNGGGTLLTFPAGMPTASIQIALHQALSGSAGAVGGGGMAPTSSDAHITPAQPAVTSISSPAMGGMIGSALPNGTDQPGSTAAALTGAGGVPGDVAAAILSALQAQGANGAVPGMVAAQQQQPAGQDGLMRTEGGEDGSLDDSESSEGGAGNKRKRA
jgi:hypothetical protein